MFDANFIANPYRAYSYLRATAPVLWIDKFRNGAWVVSRYADVLAGLHDARLSSVEAGRRAQNSLVSLTEYFRALLPERRANAL